MLLVISSNRLRLEYCHRSRLNMGEPDASKYRGYTIRRVAAHCSTQPTQSRSDTRFQILKHWELVDTVETEDEAIILIDDFVEGRRKRGK
jgi:hypothetical protein